MSVHRLLLARECEEEGGRVALEESNLTQRSEVPRLGRAR